MAGTTIVSPPTDADEWVKLAGPFTDLAGVMARLAISVEEVAGSVFDRSLLALELAGPGHAWVFPIWQFEAAVHDAIPELLPAAGYDPSRPATQWTIAAWLAQPNAELGCTSPLDLVRTGEVNRVLDLAAEVAASLGTAEREGSIGRGR